MEVKGKYEAVFIMDTAALSEEEITAITEKFKTLIAENGEIVKVDDWGRRKLAYKIDYKSEGHYVLIEFVAPKSFPAELERNFRITDGVMRYLVVRK